MGVKIREKPPGSGVYWVFINHEGKRKSKKIGKLETAEKVAGLIDAKLKFGQFAFDEKKPAGETFKMVADRWLADPEHEWRESTRESYVAALENHIFPILGKRPVADIARNELKLFFTSFFLVA